MNMNKILGKIFELNETDLKQFLSRFKAHKENYRMVFVDMGCGSISVAVYRNGETKPTLVMWEEDEDVVKHLYIPTIVGYRFWGNNQKKTVIGKSALKCNQVVQNFKQLPNNRNLATPVLVRRATSLEDGLRRRVHIPITLEEVWTDFFERVWQYTSTYAARELERLGETWSAGTDDIIFVVAHPSSEDWEKELPNYRRMILNATGLKDSQLLTISEAKAAMQYVRFNRNVTVRFGTGVVLIDLGASTIDVEYISANNPRPFERSIMMAGQDVDYVLAWAYLQKLGPGNPEYQSMDFSTLKLSEKKLRELQAEEIKRGLNRKLSEIKQDELVRQEAFFLKEFGVTRTKFLYNIRMAKENACASENGEAPLPVPKNGNIQCVLYGARKNVPDIGADTYLCLEDVLKQYAFDYTCTGAIAAALNVMYGKEPLNTTFSGTWYQHLQDMVTVMFNEYDAQNKDIANIIVTGGTCQLVGVEECIKEGIKESAKNNLVVGTNRIPITFLNTPAAYEEEVPMGSYYYIKDVLDQLDTMKSFETDLKTTVDEEIREAFADDRAAAWYPEVETIVHNTFVNWVNQEAKPYPSVEKLKANIKAQIDNKLKVGDYLEFTVTGDCQRDVLPDSFTKCETFIHDLSGASYTPQLDGIDIPIRINFANARGGIQKEISQIDYIDKMSLVTFARAAGRAVYDHVRAWVKGEDHQVDLYQVGLAQGRRLQLYNAVFADKHFADGIDTSIKEAMKTAIKDSIRGNAAGAGFGVDKQLIDALEKEINRALYIG